MFEIKERSKLKLSIYGSEYELSKPTYGQAIALQESIREGGESKSMLIMKEFLVSLGLKSEVIEQMELQHVLDLIEFISGKKKD